MLFLKVSFVSTIHQFLDEISFALTIVWKSSLYHQLSLYDYLIPLDPLKLYLATLLISLAISFAFSVTCLLPSFITFSSKSVQFLSFTYHYLVLSFLSVLVFLIHLLNLIPRSITYVCSKTFSWNHFVVFAVARSITLVSKYLFGYYWIHFYVIKSVPHSLWNMY